MVAWHREVKRTEEGLKTADSRELRHLPKRRFSTQGTPRLIRGLDISAFQKNRRPTPKALHTSLMASRTHNLVLVQPGRVETRKVS